MTDFRALCAELVDDLELCDWPYKLKETIRDDIDRARTALAEEPAVPTVMEIIELSYEIEAAGLGQVDLVRAALSRWGNPAPLPPAEGEVGELAPVPVSERLPGPEDCDAEGMCWYWRPSHPESGYLEGWMLRPSSWGVGHYDFDDSVIHTHWIPAHALPVPGAD